MRATPTSTRRSDEILVAHERETVPIARLELGHDLDAVDAADDGVTAADLAQLAADGVRVLDDDRGVHPLPLDLHPLAVDPDRV